MKIALAEHCSSRSQGESSAFGCQSIESLSVKVMASALQAKIRSRRSNHPATSQAGRGEPRLRATFSSRLNSALPAFSRAQFVAKDIATEDSTCARGR
jgi:hypothetical protein